MLSSGDSFTQTDVMVPTAITVSPRTINVAERLVCARWREPGIRVLTEFHCCQYTWTCPVPPVQSARPVGKSESPAPIGCRCRSCERPNVRSVQRLRRKRSSARSILPSFSANSSTERGRCSGSRSHPQTLSGDSRLAQVRSRYSTLHQRLSRSGGQRGTPAVPSRLFAF